LKAVFGLCLLYYGLILLKAGAAPIAETDFARDLMQGAGGSALFAFAVGAVLTMICQSSVSVSLLAIAFATSGLFNLEQSVMVVIGANLGGSGVMLMLSSNVTGIARQLAMFQISFNVIGCLVLVPLFYLETLLGSPPLLATLQAISSDVGQQIAITHLVFNATAALELFASVPIAHKYLARLYPPTTHEDDSRLAYLDEQLAANPEIAAIMIEKEQLRLMRRLPRYVDLVRREDRAAASKDLAALRESFRSVHGQAGVYIEGLSDHRLTVDSHERVYRLVERHGRLDSLEAALVDFVRAAPLIGDSSPLENTRAAFVEGLDAVLLSVVDAIESGSLDDIALIEQITADRGELMEGIRRKFLSDETLSLSREEKLGLLQITGLFERLIWMLREMTQKSVTEPPAPTQEESHDTHPLQAATS
jgi:phosphate:Na+ symporter